ncbi:MAG: hypothetical protein JNK65_06400 [Deltaproteobacteria bacterium]|nr:hypothetical protein [Deltaproteobacteria bacterium]
MNDTTQIISFVDETQAGKQVVLRKSIDHPAGAYEAKPLSAGALLAKKALEKHEATKSLSPISDDASNHQFDSVETVSVPSKFSAKPTFMAGGMKFFSQNYKEKVGNTLNPLKNSSSH